MPNGHNPNQSPITPLDTNKPPQLRRVVMTAAAIGGFLGGAFGALICCWLHGMHH